MLAIVANEVAGLPPSEKLTFGPVRAEVLSALFSTIFILVLSIFLAYSAVCRLIGELGERVVVVEGGVLLWQTARVSSRGAAVEIFYDRLSFLALALLFVRDPDVGFVVLVMENLR